MIADMESPGGDVARMYQAIKDASDYLQKEIGWFIPVNELIKMEGSGEDEISIPPVLEISSVLNDETALTSADYFKIGRDTERPWWANGPYTMLELNPETQFSAFWWDHEPDAVQIQCLRGLFLKSVSTGATVQDATKQTIGQTTLKVSNGAALSVGMVLLIGSEQELVTGYGTPIDSTTLLNGTVAITDDVIKLDDVSKVNVGEVLRVDFEQMKVRDTNTDTNQALVWRGFNKTNRVQHLDNAIVYVYRDFTVERGVNGTDAAEHATNAAIDRYEPPDDIRYLARQIATLMINKAKSQYAGKSGNDQTGVVYYNDAFPRFDIERIKEKYFYE